MSHQPPRNQSIPPLSDTKINRELIRACVAREDPTIIEIGCNDGRHTLWLLEMFANPKIYCVEPDPRAIARFKTKVGNRANVILAEMALGGHDGETSFYPSGGWRNDSDARAMPQGWDFSGSIRPPKEHLAVYPWVTFGEGTTVPASTLDAWADQHGIGTVDFIWMDVQGAEMDVFGGGANTLPRTRFIYTEYSDNELYEGQCNLEQLMRHLGKFNFEIVARYPEDVLLRNLAPVE